jgi:hypothetical protein
VDIDLSSGNEIARSLVPDVLVNPKVPAADDAKNVGAISAAATPPGLIEADAPEKPKTSATDRVPAVPPLVGMAKSAYTLLLGDPIRFLGLVR